MLILSFDFLFSFLNVKKQQQTQTRSQENKKFDLDLFYVQRFFILFFLNFFPKEEINK